ncbi:MAG: cytochrome c oxidase subunit II [Thermoleophilia bacterium]|nr:cytochrome c oxidase subunit II [Thermoleophilia bacterium]
MARRALGAVLLITVLTVAGCGGDQSTLDPQGRGADRIATLWWVMLVGAAVVFAVVLLLMALAVLRRRDGAPRATVLRPGPVMVGAGGILVPLVVLTALFVVTLRTLPGTSASANGGDRDAAVVVEARQWFWNVDYPSAGIREANVIHIPVGRPVDVAVRSYDVVHSLWVPQLNRKVDAIPGTENHVTFQADRPGTFRGQCAEFCGVQHAHMALQVIAMPQAAYDRWRAGDRATPPVRPAAAEAGEQVFMSSACVYCHRIEGTNASGNVGPDLTHLASRPTLAGGVVPNTPGYLAGWILDPQHLKPGTLMPGTDLSGPELQRLLAYLGTLR